MARSKSSDQWLREHFSDAYVKRAQKEGYRARAVYKLQEIDQRDRLFKPGMSVVDLGAAPGSWAQYARAAIGPQGRVLALDILPMAALAGVEFIQGDFTEAAVLAQVEELLQGRAVDLVISDMAPNISGVAVSDQARAAYLAELALDFARGCLAPGGRLLLKTFQGQGYAALYKEMQLSFKKVIARKPQASRARSRELYLLGNDYRLKA